MNSQDDTLLADEISIPSDSARGQEVQERIIAQLEAHEFPQRDLFCMQLALAEAVTNAIRHGNRMDPNKQVTISWELNQERVRVVIADQGAGFDHTDLLDPTAEENLERPGGRGIMLMRSFLDVMEYSDNGTRLTIEKKRATD